MIWASPILVAGEANVSTVTTTGSIFAWGVETMGERHAFGLRLHRDSHPRRKPCLVSGKHNRGGTAAGTDRTSAANRQGSALRCRAGRTAGRWLSRGATA